MLKIPAWWGDLFVYYVKVAFVLFTCWFLNQQRAGYRSDFGLLFFGCIIFCKHSLWHLLVGLLKTWMANSWGKTGRQDFGAEIGTLEESQAWGARTKRGATRQNRGYCNQVTLRASWEQVYINKKSLSLFGNCHTKKKKKVPFYQPQLLTHHLARLVLSRLLRLPSL